MAGVVPCGPPRVGRDGGPWVPGSMPQSSADLQDSNQASVAVGDSLLRTKLSVPPVRANRVGRPRLIDKLNTGLDKALILVSAPAGYGKTTLVSGWLRELGIPSAWLSLDEDDNEPRRFLEYFVAALAGIVPGIPADAARMLPGTAPAALEALLTVLINEISLQSKPLVLVLDDVHLIHSQSVLDVLAFLLAHIPPELHLVLLSRSDPALPLARLRARDQLLDLRLQDLRFDGREVAAFLEQVMELKLAQADIALVEARTEGWIAGLQLAALSMKGGRDAHGFVEEFAGRQDYLVDYLVQEVLNAQTAEVSAFLLHTSGLGRMCAALCDAVVEPAGPRASSGQAMLERLEQLNLFVTPLDEHRRWYRYHPLFADILHRRFMHQQPDLSRQADARAAAWYEANGAIPEAIHHSIVAGDQVAAVRLIEHNGCTLLIRGEVLTLSRWLDAVQESGRGRAWFPIYRGWIAALTGDSARVEDYLLQADQLIAALPSDADVGTLRGALATARAHNANLQGQAALAADFARQALTHLKATDDTACSLRVVAISLLGDASSLTGDLDTAWNAYSEAAKAIRAIGDVHLNVILNSNLGNVLAEKGQLRKAASLYRDTVQLAALPTGRTAPIGGRACIELAQVCYEWNELDQASDLVERGLALCRGWGNRDDEAVGLILRACLSAVHGDAAARSSIQDAVDLAGEYRLAPSHTAWVRAHAAQLWLAQGETDKAEDLIAASGLTPETEVSHLRELEFTMLVRLDLARRDHAAARRLVERLLPAMEAGRRNGRLIGFLLLHGIALQGLGETDAALSSVGRALSLGRPEGYVRTFVDEGEPLARLLYLARTRDIEPGFVARLLAIGRSEHAPAAQPVQLLVEPLTSRELEILKLIDGGCSNQDIARQLVISPATVKRHISNIYTKLEVQGRTQALARSRELGLLS